MLQGLLVNFWMRPANISGARIKEARERLGGGQVELAAALDVDFEIKLDQSDISEIERQVRGVKDYELEDKEATLLY